MKIKNKLVKSVLLSAAVIMTFCFTACGSETASEPEGPYIGFTPETVESQAKMDVVECALESAPAASLATLRYDAKANNKAVVKIESANKDGSWETVQEKELNLQQNVNKGVMAIYINDEDGKISVNTAMEEIGDSALMNKIEFDFPNNKYFTRNYFGSDKGISELSEEEILAKTDDMDMTSKKVIVMFTEDDFPLLNEKGDIISYDEADDNIYTAEINDIYENKEGKFADAYNQGMLAVTMEFANDKLLDKTPYIQSENGKYKYDAGMYGTGIVHLKKSTPDGKWKNVEDEGFLLFSGAHRKGTLTVDVDEPFKTVTLQTDGIQYKTADGEDVPNAWSYKIPKGCTLCEYDTESFTEPVSAKKAVPMMLFSDKQGMKAKDGLNVLEFYRNKDGSYSKIYKDNTYYVVTVEFLAQ